MNSIGDMLGLTLTSVQGGVGSEEIRFETKEGRRFRMYHDQGCCESVSVEDIDGDFSGLIGSPLLMAEEVSNPTEELDKDRSFDDSHTWTFYKLGTVRESVTIRWLGESNGYYSESVDFQELDGEKVEV